MKCIYALIDPRDESIRYVGKANSPKVRLQNHLCPSNLKRSRHCSRWLALLKKLNLKPKLAILQEVKDDENWEDIEIAWIKHFRESGYDLTNILAEGEGGATYGRLGKPWSNEQRLRYSETRVGMKVATPNPEALKRRGLAIKAHWDKVRATGGKKKGPVHSPETKVKLRIAHLGKALVSNHKRKLSLAKTGRGPSVFKALGKRKENIDV